MSYLGLINPVIAPGNGTVTPATISQGGPSWDTSGNVTLTGNITLNNGTADGAQLTLNSAGYSAWNWDNYSGRLRAYYGATEYFTIDTSGNVGIGTSSPDAKLTLKNPSVTGEQTVLDVHGATNSTKLFYTSVNQSTDVVNIGTGYGAPFAFVTNSTERARITSAGDFCVGMTTSGNGAIACTKNVADYVVQAYNSHASTPYGYAMTFNAAAPNNTSSYFIYVADNSSVRFRVNSNGGVANFSANNTNLSDRREKTNFAPAGEYLAKICAIPVQTFNYVDQNLEEDDGLTLGVVAQDVQEVAPELVLESNWGTEEEPKMRLSIYQTDLQYALMKCIQEQQAQISSQAAVITSLTERIAALEAK